MPDRDREEGHDSKLRKISDLLSERKRDDYESLRRRLTKASELFHELVVERLCEPLNTHLASLPAESLEQKQEVSRIVNRDLRAIGLTLRCPVTGEPAILRARPGLGQPGGRFQFELTGPEAERRVTRSSSKLFTLELMGRPVDAPPSHDESWTGRSRKGGEGKQER